MTVRFKMHKPDQDLGAWAEAQGRRIKEELDKILEDVIAEAAEDMIRILEAAWTQTGADRAEAGGNGPGRVDSGTMRDAIRSRILTKTKDRTVGAWGWLDEFLEYFLFQEAGSEKYDVQFEGMSALQGSFVQARENFRTRLREIGREV
ncbi:hypothetical protein [Microbacterium sp. zg-YB36]|uniref:hypothetical protein n=1 Tax=Microbacterium sp. zg-YB36 TaxID=2969407 RepID=UPI00214C65B3|nr:hypothetical protein [Microbacterium sp. zg-YB36]MDL5351095.1 hypothetical protein [Microbacterium sp. zg-YB36]